MSKPKEFFPFSPFHGPALPGELGERDRPGTPNARVMEQMRAEADALGKIYHKPYEFRRVENRRRGGWDAYVCPHDWPKERCVPSEPANIYFAPPFWRGWFCGR